MVSLMPGLRIREIFDSRLASLIRVGGITLYPFIFYHPSIASMSPTRIRAIRRHEWEHIKQVRHHGWFKFYASYLWQYVKGRFKGLSHHASYASISFELEAHAVMYDGQEPWLEG